MAQINEIIKTLSDVPRISERDFFGILHNVLEAKDPYTAQLQKLTAEYSVKIGYEIARELKLGKKSLLLLKQAAFVSEIGKIAVPDFILYNSASLSKKQQEVMQMHPESGARILSALRDNRYHYLTEFVRYHHERWDGKGYPRGLRGDEIMIYSRIIGVAEQYALFTSVRPYRHAHSPGFAMDKIKEQSGTAFDPAVVSALEKVVLKEAAKK